MGGGSTGRGWGRLFAKGAARARVTIDPMFLLKEDLPLLAEEALADDVWKHALPVRING